MTHDPANLTMADYLDGAREMAAAGRPFLAHLLAEEAARRVGDPAAARSIRAQYTDPTTYRG
ncbi:hypothetical protein PV394_24415 [Streptomyces sp. NE06-03E]|uniref:Uncharacterized protein n=1 Tax=Streptomyces sp. gb1(2016) TaxID=1828321 RepID=A0A652KHW3_9ACTN|nr:MULTISPECIES: hypothetical protein [unclassified Streptomyces]MDX3058242.1 hypothetical protein [Streptomyces sp. NE06-03E]TXS23307.1 hypothetical protein EAO74_21975 [Streptomyces sp. gb1(2016)]